MSTELPLSVRSVLNRWFSVIILLGLVLMIVGGYGVYDAYIEDAETVTEQQVIGSSAVASEFDHAATVINGSGIFRERTQLTDRSLYFISATPNLSATYRLTQDSATGAPATASIRVSLIIQSVEDDTVYWEERDTLEDIENTEIQDDEEVSVSVEINVSAIQDRIDTIQTKLGASPGDPVVTLRADATIEGAAGDDEFIDNRADRIEIELGEAVYRVGTDVQDESTYDATNRVSRTVEPSRIILYGGPLAFISGLSGMLALSIARWRGLLTVTDDERARQDFESARDDFAEWISTATIPAEIDRTRITTDTLADLVDIAIDSNRRVLEDDGRYAVITGDILYEYTPPSSVGQSNDMSDPESEKMNDDAETTVTEIPDLSLLDYPAEVPDHDMQKSHEEGDQKT